ncbi:YbaN family protein [Flexibacterium corallicola]|uniref:YbaN family protein n=1 Tax=Flexibacterium corallicola TaxID=3037259 RepID=UPI00286F8D4F|nr:YbaN family protein [Pseudovibrio sp. M1P-2-3]
MIRAFYFSSGFLFIGIGLVGIVLPLLPSTIFFILAAGCFAKSSKRFELWLLEHPVFGPSVIQWRAHGVISLKAKTMAFLGMLLGYCSFYYFVSPSLVSAVVVALFMLASAYYVGTRPSKPPAF